VLAAGQADATQYNLGRKGYSLLVDLLLFEVGELLACRAEDGIRRADVRLARFAIAIVSSCTNECCGERIVHTH
jgi:hypothetical protein